MKNVFHRGDRFFSAEIEINLCLNQDIRANFCGAPLVAGGYRATISRTIVQDFRRVERVENAL